MSCAMLFAYGQTEFIWKGVYLSYSVQKGVSSVLSLSTRTCKAGKQYAIASSIMAEKSR
jgi:hypothetical protein